MNYFEPRPVFDEKDAEILKARVVEYDAIPGPRVGDFVRFADGTLARFSYNWGDGLQWSKSGSWHIFRNGIVSFSGGLYPPIDKKTLTPTSETMAGKFWFFHHDCPGANRGVDVEIVCRVFSCSQTNDGWLKE